MVMSTQDKPAMFFSQTAISRQHLNLRYEVGFGQLLGPTAVLEMAGGRIYARSRATKLEI